MFGHVQHAPIQSEKKCGIPTFFREELIVVRGKILIVEDDANFRGHRRNGENWSVNQPRKLNQSPDPFLGTSMAIRAIAQKAKKLLLTDSPILIQGETGTGKGVLAAWFHYHG